MGLIFARFRRKSAEERLDAICKDIERIDRFTKHDQQREKRIVGTLLLYSFLIYAISALSLYFYLFPETWRLRIMYSAPLLIFPLIIWFVKRFLHWFFIRRIAANEARLEELREKKTDLLNHIMETETYKRAREILQKFDPDFLSQSILSARIDPVPSKKSSPVQQLRSMENQELRHRSQSETSILTQSQNEAPVVSPSPPLPTKSTTLDDSRDDTLRHSSGDLFTQTQVSSLTNQHTPSVSFSQSVETITSTPAVINYPQQLAPPSELVRPVLPLDRGALERLVEYMIGDGPTNRYALICQNCYCHNGMALKEEFEFLAYRCCYCFTFNPAKRQRPTAPRITPNNSMIDSFDTDSAALAYKHTRVMNTESLLVPSEEDSHVEACDENDDNCTDNSNEINEMNDDSDVDDVPNLEPVEKTDE